MYVYQYICIYIYIYIYVLIYLQCIHLHAYIYTYECLYISIITYKFKLFIYISIYLISRMRSVHIDWFLHTYTHTYICQHPVLGSIGPPPCPRESAQLAGASGNFFSRINTFFLTFIVFLKKKLKKSTFSKIFDFINFLASGVQSSCQVLPQLEAID